MGQLSDKGQCTTEAAVVMTMKGKDVADTKAGAQIETSTTKPPAETVGVSLSPKPSLLSLLLFLFVSPIVRCV